MSDIVILDNDVVISGELCCGCRGCNAPAFGGLSVLFEHVNTMHAATKGPCMWGDCGFVGNTKQILQRHLRTHTGEKPYACDVCDAAFARSADLTKHKRAHTGEKPYPCNICDAAFARPDHLTSHKRTHSGEKPYSCDLCDAAFAWSGSLVKHKRTHMRV